MAPAAYHQHGVEDARLVFRQPPHPRAILAADGREYRLEGVEFEGNLVDRGRAARQHWYQFFRELVALRKKHRPLTDGACAVLDVGEDAPARGRTVIAFDRRLGRQLLRCGSI